MTADEDRDGRPKGKETREIVSFQIWNKAAERVEDHVLKRYVVHGADDGPHVVVVAGLHGDELLAIDTAKQLFKDLDPDTVRGTVSVVPTANIFAVAKGTRETPVPEYEPYEDEERNLNRCFDAVDLEAGEHGPLTTRLSYHLLDLIADADCCLDLHTATDPGYKIDQIRRKTDPGFANDVQRAQERLVKGSGLEYVIRTPASDIGPGILAGVAPRHGVPTVTVEIGGGLYTESELAEYLDVVRNLLTVAGALPGDPPRTDQHIYRDLVKVSAPAAGTYEGRVEPGDTVAKGDTIATITSDRGTHEVAAPYDGLVESVHRKDWVNEGTKLGHIAVRKERGPIAALVRALSRTLESLLPRASTPS